MSLLAVGCLALLAAGQFVFDPRQALFVRSGRTFSLRYSLNGIEDDFLASATDSP